MSDSYPQSHPAPQRDRASLALLLFGLAGGCAGWITQLVLGYGLAAYLCQPGGEPRPGPPPIAWTSEHGVLLFINIACLAIAGASFLAAFLSWRRTSLEKAGDAHRLAETGEGRTRFLALCGMTASLMFGAAILFDTAPIVAVPACWEQSP